ncbi:hypothetical protein DFP72DRAFT_75060 [Ephemerocybe angulata]|uniref:Uncharacterized protein n=1 Tax=Ephemerocybe angulata TaxID=980116 RepID=A0A8H6MC73_9AGAR|nr:hypothetical protein DFP72DRAFT_75060 [Tulosesus angulatus]
MSALEIIEGTGRERQNAVRTGIIRLAPAGRWEGPCAEEGYITQANSRSLPPTKGIHPELCPPVLCMFFNRDMYLGRTSRPAHQRATEEHHGPLEHRQLSSSTTLQRRIVGVEVVVIFVGIGMQAKRRGSPAIPSRTHRIESSIIVRFSERLNRTYPRARDVVGNLGSPNRIVVPRVQTRSFNSKMVPYLLSFCWDLPLARLHSVGTSIYLAYA